MSRIIRNVVKEINITDDIVQPQEYIELFHFFQIVIAVSAPIHYEYMNSKPATEMYPHEPPQLALALTHGKRYENNFYRIQAKIKEILENTETHVKKIIFQSDLFEKLSDETSRIMSLLDDERDELMRFYFEEIESKKLKEDSPEIAMFRAMCRMVKEQANQYSPRSLDKEIPGLNCSPERLRKYGEDNSIQYEEYRDCFSPRFDPGTPITPRSPLITPRNIKHRRRRSIG